MRVDSGLPRGQGAANCRRIGRRPGSRPRAKKGRLRPRRCETIL